MTLKNLVQRVKESKIGRRIGFTLAGIAAMYGVTTAADLTVKSYTQEGNLMPDALITIVQNSDTSKQRTNALGEATFYALTADSVEIEMTGDDIIGAKKKILPVGYTTFSAGSIIRNPFSNYFGQTVTLHTAGIKEVAGVNDIDTFDLFTWDLSSKGKDANIPYSCDPGLTTAEIQGILDGVAEFNAKTERTYFTPGNVVAGVTLGVYLEPGSYDASWLTFNGFLFNSVLYVCRPIIDVKSVTHELWRGVCGFTGYVDSYSPTNFSEQSSSSLTALDAMNINAVYDFKRLKDHGINDFNLSSCSDNIVNSLSTPIILAQPVADISVADTVSQVVLSDDLSQNFSGASSYTATSSNPNFNVSTVGNRLVLTFPSGYDGSTNILVKAKNLENAVAYDQSTVTTTKVTPVNHVPYVAVPLVDKDMNKDVGRIVMASNVKEIIKDEDNNIVQYTATSTNPNIHVEIKSDTLIATAPLLFHGTGYIILLARDFYGASVSDTSKLTINNQTPVEHIPNMPLEFKLEQNYPNPFNPTTNITFSIPANLVKAWSLDKVKAKATVSLRVYDILGREIAVLVNEEKPSGEYQIEFNASHLPSGVYYYRLSTGNYAEVKKMLLVK